MTGITMIDIVITVPKTNTTEEKEKGDTATAIVDEGPGLLSVDVTVAVTTLLRARRRL